MDSTLVERYVMNATEQEMFPLSYQILKEEKQGQKWSKQS